ncbi:histone-lysine N-methyltransferase SETMAR [Aphomia sociella]
MNDVYIHSNKNLIYIVENIPGPKEESQEYDEIIDNFNSQLSDHCVCQEKCFQNKCLCLNKLESANYIPSTLNKQIFVLNSGRHESSTYPILECNDLCSCSNACGNRVVQKGPIEGLIVKMCADEVKGLGLFTENHITRGMFICEYAGEVITRSEAHARHRANVIQGNMNYIFCLQEHSNENVVQFFVDPSKFGNIGRYINHSCKPNCCIVPVRVNTPIPKLAIFSCSDILPDTEITFNYGQCNNDIRDNTSRTKCLCYSENCVRWMPFHVY